jgi:hypothetical protein
MHDNLIFDAGMPLDVKTATLAAGQGVLLRGSLIAEDGTLFSAAEVITPGAEYGDPSTTTGSNPDAILAADADTGTGGTVNAAAYRTGHFVRQSVILAEGATLTAEAEKILRDAGIYLSSAAL